MIQEYTVIERTKKKDAAGNITYKEKEVKKYRFKCYYTTATGERKQKCSKYFPSRPKAKAAEDQFLLDSENRIHFQGVKFHDLYIMYKTDTEHNVEESTQYTRISKIENLILPYFEDMLIDKITPLTVRQWQIELLNKRYVVQKEDKKLNKQEIIKPYSKRYLTELHMYLTAILEYGVKYYNLPQNVAKIQANFKSKRVHEVKINENFYTFEEYTKFIQYVPDDWRIVFDFLYYTGCRVGEMLALTWLDYNGSTIKINKSLTKKTRAASYLIKSVKTKASIREVDLPDNLVLALNKYHKHEEMKDTFNNSWFIFGGLTPLAHSTLRRRADEAMAAADLKHITIHGFRHSHASLLINGGMNIKLISERLGHASVTETLDTYTHMFPEQRTICVAYLNSLNTSKESNK